MFDFYQRVKRLKTLSEISVCIVTSASGQKTGYTPLSNMIKLFSGLANRVYMISGSVVLKKLDLGKDRSNIFMRIGNQMYLQLKILCCLIMMLRKVDLFVFFIGGEMLLVPMLLLRLMRKKTMLTLAGNTTKIYSILKDPLFKFALFLITINLFLVNRLIVYSYRLIQEGGLERYQHKTLIAHEHFIDFAKFAMRKKINERASTVGYIGSYTLEKGPLNFVRSIPLVLKKRKDVNFVICGGAWPSFDEFKKTINNENVKAYVKLMGWIPHKDIPQYLNGLKILVLPSFSEGLPNILLEAMACGTPVLTTPVGAIPDIIKDGETGFLLKSNDPKHIAEKIIELLNKPELLEKVSTNAYKYVRENFNYDKTLDAWRKIFKQLEIA